MIGSSVFGEKKGGGNEKKAHSNGILTSTNAFQFSGNKTYHRPFAHNAIKISYKFRSTWLLELIWNEVTSRSALTAKENARLL
ncbi:hypothetical protein CEXT_408771 [Caerostris extrusa]|uniref:Uncharacterized protein n=1 Tax=Caerostris extrusa TaxID=172846 RepID=A0AAV4WPW8_CAEEX|nr:hypothetical protein CEXT_408771 [Caerostris extrusa]